MVEIQFLLIYVIRSLALQSLAKSASPPAPLGIVAPPKNQSPCRSPYQTQSSVGSGARVPWRTSKIQLLLVILRSCSNGRIGVHGRVDFRNRATRLIFTCSPQFAGIDYCVFAQGTRRAAGNFDHLHTTVPGSYWKRCRAIQSFGVRLDTINGKKCHYYYVMSAHDSGI
jgi:hypothetical protein